MRKAAVIIPNYNGMTYIRGCLDSLRQQSVQDFSVILVDNGSTDGSREIVQKEYPWVQLVCLPENTGFCGAVNRGIQAVDEPYVILLNNDTVAEPDFVKELVEGICRHRKAFACAAKMLQASDSRLIDDAGDLYTALGWAVARGKDKPQEQYQKEEQIFSACGGAAIYRRQLLLGMGLFDEEHFAYLEDLDIGYRARLYGYENWFLPKARVIHVGSGTSGSRYNLFKVRYSSRNNVYLIWKNMPLFQIILNMPFFIVGFGIKFLFFLKKGYGREYLAGILNGLQLRKGHGQKVPFQWKRMPRYLKIQLELWRNLGRLRA